MTRPTDFHDELRSVYSERVCRPPQYRFLLTSEELVLVRVADRFTAQILDLHWKAIVDFFCDRADELDEFSGIEIDGHRLVCDSTDLATWPGRSAERDG